MAHWATITSKNRGKLKSNNKNTRELQKKPTKLKAEKNKEPHSPDDGRCRRQPKIARKGTNRSEMMPFPCYFGRRNQNQKQKQKQRRWKWRKRREWVGKIGRDEFRIRNGVLRYGKKDQSKVSLWFDYRINVIHVRTPCCCHWQPIVFHKNHFLGLRNCLRNNHKDKIFLENVNFKFFISYF